MLDDSKTLFRSSITRPRLPSCPFCLTNRTFKPSVGADEDDIWRVATVSSPVAYWALWQYPAPSLGTRLSHRDHHNRHHRHHIIIMTILQIGRLSPAWDQMKMISEGLLLLVAQ